MTDSQWKIIAETFLKMDSLCGKWRITVSQDENGEINIHPTPQLKIPANIEENAKTEEIIKNHLTIISESVIL